MSSLKKEKDKGKKRA
jgi:hypothetical protein